MSFEPVFLRRRATDRDHAAASYTTRHKDGRVSIRVSAELARRVSVPVKAWRLDVDRQARRARLTALIQHDHHPATRPHPPKLAEGRVASLYLDWKRRDEIATLFPPAENGAVELRNITVDPKLGIEFDLPGAAPKAAPKPVTPPAPEPVEPAEPEEPERATKPDTEPAAPKPKPAKQWPAPGTYRKAKQITPAAADAATAARKALAKRAVQIRDTGEGFAAIGELLGVTPEEARQLVLEGRAAA